MKVGFTPKYDIKSKDWDMDHINTVVDIYGNVSKSIYL